MAGQRIYYGSERRHHEGFVGRATLLVRLDGSRFAADSEATGRALGKGAAPGRGLDARFLEDVMARANDNLASRTQDPVALESILAGWFEDVAERGVE